MHHGTSANSRSPASICPRRIPEDRRIVLLGESTHGTEEFYRTRAAITRRLVEERGGLPDATIEEHVHSADIATAMQAVNAIPALCESSPGLKTAFDLMPVVSGTGFRSPGD